MLKLPTRLVATALFVAPFAVSAAPQSECKGMSKTLCGETSACSWVATYTRKDGRVVNGYCRTVGKRQPKASRRLDSSSDGISLLDNTSRKVQ